MSITNNNDNKSKQAKKQKIEQLSKKKVEQIKNRKIENYENVFTMLIFKHKSH